MIISTLVCLFIFLLTSHSVFASVVINEVSPRTSPEWIELYNPDSVPIDLTGWYFKDASGTKKLIAQPESFLSNTYYLATGYSSWLNNSGLESLYLFDSTDNMVDSVSFDETNEDTTVARVPDFTGAWLLDQVSTPLATNVQPSPSITPTPTPDPSPSVSPTPTPTPSPTPLPSTLAAAQKPSPSPSVLPSLKPSPTPSPSPSTLPYATTPSDFHSPEGTVAGETTIDLSGYGSTSSPSVDPSLPSESSSLSLNKSRAKVLIFVGAGLSLLSLAIYLWLRRKNEGIINE